MNRKGYLMVEVVVATVIAVSISFFLINIVMNIMSKTDDITEELKYMTVNTSISKVLEEDLSHFQISELSFNSSSKEVYFTYNFCPENEEKLCENIRKKILITKENNKTYFKYGSIKEDNSFDTDDTSYYVREIPKELTLDEIIFSDNKDLYPNANIYDSILVMTIPMRNIFENKNYDIKVAIGYTKDKINLNL